MRKITVITCFSYTGNKKYVFNPSHLKSDLRRIISFSHNRMGCDLQRIYVLTDIVPSPEICTEILEDYHQVAERVLMKTMGMSKANIKTIFRQVQNYAARPLRWLKEVWKRLPGKINHEQLLKEIIPVLRNSSVVEFASLFTKFAIINNAHHYQTALNTIFSHPISHLFFYYTGHGIKIYPNWDTTTHEVCLVIPNKKRHDEMVDYCSQQDLQVCFEPILKNSHAFIVFDCCYGQNLIKLPVTGYKNIQEIIYLSSTQSDQTCGFYISQKENGSVYTYYLLKFLNDIADRIAKTEQKLNLSHLYDEVEEKVNRYRLKSGKPPQNMFVSLSNEHIRELPDWLFSRIYKNTGGFNLIEMPG